MFWGSLPPRHRTNLGDLRAERHGRARAGLDPRHLDIVLLDPLGIDQIAEAAEFGVHGLPRHVETLAKQRPELVCSERVGNEWVGVSGIVRNG